VGDVKQAFDCPADDYVFPVEGISYYYYNELGEVQLGQTFFWQIFKNSSQGAPCCGIRPLFTERPADQQLAVYRWPR